MLCEVCRTAWLALSSQCVCAIWPAHWYSFVIHILETNCCAFCWWRGFFAARRSCMITLAIRPPPFFFSWCLGEWLFTHRTSCPLAGRVGGTFWRNQLWDGINASFKPSFACQKRGGEAKSCTLHLSSQLRPLSLQPLGPAHYRCCCHEAKSVLTRQHNSLRRERNFTNVSSNTRNC